MTTPQPIEPSELLAHAGWMRALAGSLVADAASADDVVQESLVAALHRPPAPGRPLEAWLSRVVRNVASNFRRRESAQVVRRAQAVEKEGFTDPAEIIERLDTQRMIVELVRELDEPSRSTIVLRYFEGLSSEEIGRRMGVSDATVRWRLQKALEQLRSRLQRNFGSREAWCAVLAPLANFPITGTVAASSGAAAGAIVMGTASKLAVAAAAAVVLGTGLWFAIDRETPAVSVAAAEAAESNKSEKLIEPVVPASPEREALSTSVDPASLPRPSVPAPIADPSPVGESSVGVRARFVDPAGRPYSDVTLSMRHDWALTDKSKGSATSTVDGIAELSFAIPDTYSDPNFELAATREGCASRKLNVLMVRGRVIDLGDVVLEREARILGMVHDAQGVGLAGVSVGLFAEDQFPPRAAEMRRRGPSSLDRLIVAQSDARGAFELRAAPAGKWRLWGHREDLGYGCTEAFEIQAGAEKSDFNFEVPALLPTDTITGTVIDPEGKPVAQAFVSYGWASDQGSGSCGAASEVDGSFKLVLNTESPGDLSGRDRDHRLASTVLRDVVPGTRGIVVQLADLTAQPRARLRIHGPENEPVHGAKAALYERQKHGGYNGGPLTINEVEPGCYEFQVPQFPFYLILSADRYVKGKLADLDPKSLPTELEIGLETSPLLNGRISADGKAISKARVEALPAVRKGNGITVGGFPCLMNPWVDVEATSNDEGAFTLMLQGNDTVYLRCEAAGFAPKIVGPIEIDGSTEPVEIALDVGGAIQGHVRAKDGTPVAGAIVGITCGDGHPQTRLSDREGLFRFEALTAGKWLVMQSKEEVTDASTMQTSGL